MIRKSVGAIVFQNDKFLIVHKTKINTKLGKETIQGEWDIIKGGVKESDSSYRNSIVREIEEETGSRNYKIIKQFDEKMCFEFSSVIKEKIGFERQVTTLFLVEYLGDINSLKSLDNEISDIKFVTKDLLIDKLTHKDTIEFFMKHILMEVTINEIL